MANLGIRQSMMRSLIDGTNIFFSPPHHQLPFRPLQGAQRPPPSPSPISYPASRYSFWSAFWIKLIDTERCFINLHPARIPGVISLRSSLIMHYSI